MTITDTPGKVGRYHPRTSYAAAMNANVRGQKERLLRRLLVAGSDGLTAYEASMIVGISPNQTATRMMELREDGLVVRLTVTRETTPGNTGHVHVAEYHAGAYDADQVEAAPPARVPMAELRRLAAIGTRVEAAIEARRHENFPPTITTEILIRLATGKAP